MLCHFEDVQKLFLCWQIEHTVGFTKYVWCCYTGESCAAVNTEADSNKVTERLHDDKPRPFVCSRRSIQKERLSDHRNRQTGENEYVCDHCKKRFSSKSNLIKHMNIHTHDYRCTECCKCCRSGSELAIHRRSHSGEKPFECRPLLFVANDLQGQVTLWVTAEFTVERNRTNVACVTRRLVSL